ncbi:4Fe-4S dicluster domain-containing protein [Cellulosilyticum ruminicola]|uniref:4Fe-4S dicluster domain-containing protein n=1 Tax=Cellulosilyticum ruminicola TaxID=425254 RepID=UPI0006D268B2|nr:4Fe-4S dicluster domain-containing protein [Cellulosilyticum ruminicola]
MLKKQPGSIIRIKYFSKENIAKKNHETKAVIRKAIDIHLINSKDLTTYSNLSNEEINQSLTREKLIELCESLRLTGRSGNGFLVADKLKAYKSQKGILLINGVECDPGLIHDAWLYRNQLAKVQQGADILQKALGFEKVILATKEPIREGKFKYSQIKIRDQFPMGYENYLIKTVLGRKVPQGKRATDMGILVMNLQTVLAIVEAVNNRASAYTKWITIADMRSAKAYAVKVELGKDIMEIIKQVFRTQVFSKGEVFAGEGALNCHELEKDEVITDTTSFVAIGSMPNYSKAKKCVKCGKCSRKCSAGVEVLNIIQHVQKYGKVNRQACQSYHPEKCIGCGACTYGCGAGKDVRGIVGWAKGENI